MLFVAEIGMNHDGNFDLAYELIRRAKLAGADIAKFQFGWRDGPGEINHIDLDRAMQFKGWCEYLGVEFMASLITDEALELGQAIGQKRNKIASRTVVDRPDLCKKIIADGKETFVSLGMWDGPGWPFGPPSDQLHYIYCRSKYPTYPQDMADMPGCFTADAFYGYSDHCHGIAGCLLALSRGAQHVEKHFTLNKTSLVIRDHLLSATPEEFQVLSETGGELARLVRVAG